LLDEPLFHCLKNRLIEIEPPALQSLLQWPKHGIVTRGFSRKPQPERRRVSRVTWAACGRALSWSISTPQHSFPVFIGIVAAYVYVSIEQLLYKVFAFILSWSPFVFMQFLRSSVSLLQLSLKLNAHREYSDLVKLNNKISGKVIRINAETDL
jgi:hypothetical protein